MRTTDDVPALLGHITRNPSLTNGSGSWKHKKKDGSIIDVDVNQSGGKHAIKTIFKFLLINISYIIMLVFLFAFFGVFSFFKI